MRNLIPFFNYEIKKKLENQLQIEESGSKIATIQEKLAGFRSMMQKKVGVYILPKTGIFSFNIINDWKDAVYKQYEFLKKEKKFIIAI